MPTGDLDTARDVVGQFNRATDRFIAVSERLASTLHSQPPSHGNSQINVQVGGAAVWLCALFCAISVTAVFSGLLQLSEARDDIRELRQENQTMRDYLSAIYMMAPSLKPADQDLANSP